MKNITHQQLQVSYHHPHVVVTVEEETKPSTKARWKKTFNPVGIQAGLHPGYKSG